MKISTGGHGGSLSKSSSKPWILNKISIAFPIDLGEVPGPVAPFPNGMPMVYCIVYEYLINVILLSLWIIASFLDTIYDKGIGETIFQFKFAGLLLT